MATMEKPPVVLSSLDDISELRASLPSPFPRPIEGRQTSRSPSASRMGMGGLMDKVKRAMSKDRGTGVEGERRGRESVVGGGGESPFSL